MLTLNTHRPLPFLISLLSLCFLKFREINIWLINKNSLNGPTVGHLPWINARKEDSNEPRNLPISCQRK